MSNRKREQQMVQKGFQFQESLKQVHCVWSMYCTSIQRTHSKKIQNIA